ncbi:sugar kinase [Ralstonia pseudosolanacearum]|uniref:Fructokinase n=4 Tax=Ralstonia solanacearum species complex TaxID=3116862 RepID=A0A0S4V490_RALSL|nr:sugar kinase [Ralstonia pseudosolanacearum]KAF3460751.1 sugar kinase [Ralstonia solanacearum]ASL74500.1 carbohydrate kinase [Ralstonia pseudosolanacearum]AST86046.1 sugar kinase [Ralstonia pseudosolanacearum]MCK4115844.1 sugar kinase [Ralstonia pseudosolanacearum]MCK4126592.1 sugar kinase [Ralstonia pseudosolanacearum]
MAAIVVAGELLAEFVAAERGQMLAEPGAFIGPFPSGAPAIFADQAARQGASVAYAGCVGHDVFGDAIIARLERDGVDTAQIRRIERPTGTAFVAYRDDGSRSFVYNIAHSASGCFDASDVDTRLFEGCRYFHVMGSSLSSDGAIAAIRRGLMEAARVGAKISFDPNVRAEMLGFQPMRAALNDILAVCHLFLPSEADLPFFCGAQAPERAIEALLATYPLLERVVLKRGAAGSTAFDRGGSVAVPAYPVGEVDPTGAGDCFGGTLLAALVAGLPIDAALRRANAAGALAVMQRGPMEGNSHAADIDRFLAERGVACPA